MCRSSIILEKLWVLEISTQASSISERQLRGSRTEDVLRSSAVPPYELPSASSGLFVETRVGLS